MNEAIISILNQEVSNKVKAEFLETMLNQQRQRKRIVNVGITYEQHNKIREIAHKEYVSINFVVQRAVETELKKLEGKT